MKNHNFKRILGKTAATFSALLLSLFLCSFKIAPFETTEDEAKVVDMALIAIIILSLIVIITSVVFIIFVFKERKGERKFAIEITERLKGRGQKGGQRATGKERFSMLCRIDSSNSEPKAVIYPENSLEEICVGFRNYAASRLGLYYSIDDIRSFIAGLATSRFMIMQGISGTGKTSLAYALGRFLANPSRIIPVQPMWKESSDMLGYFNEFTDKFNETNMLLSLYEAQYTESMCVTVLDEMNIARVEYYFAEFLSLMELPNIDDRKIRITSSTREDDPKLLTEGQLRLPHNMWFIGTANNDDSTFGISDKVYDRAMIVNLDEKAEPFDAPYTEEMHISAKQFDMLAVNAENRVKLSPEGRKKLRALDKALGRTMQISFGNRIQRQIQRYVSAYILCGGAEEDAIDDMISKKVLRKLEAQNPIYVSAALGDLLDNIDSIYGSDSLPRCRKYLSRFQRL